MKGILVEELEDFEMRVKLLDYGELFLQHVLDYVSYRHVVGESDSISDRDELAASETEKY